MGARKVALALAALLAAALAGCNTAGLPSNSFSNTVDCAWSGSVGINTQFSCTVNGHLHHSVGQ